MVREHRAIHRTLPGSDCALREYANTHLYKCTYAHKVGNDDEIEIAPSYAYTRGKSLTISVHYLDKGEESQKFVNLVKGANTPDTAFQQELEAVEVHAGQRSAIRSLCHPRGGRQHPGVVV